MNVFFILAQILSFLIFPLTWIIALFLLALFLKNKKWARRCLIYGIIILLFFTNSFIANVAVGFWEYPITLDDEMTSDYDVGIVLGGGMVTIDAQNKRMTFRDNVDRMLQAAYLYKKGKIKKILFSGGSGSLIFRDMRESVLLKKYWLDLGIPDSVMLVDTISDNTYQNAIYSAKILNNVCPHGKFLLITSSIHLRRAMGCFKKAGIKVIPYGTNKRTGNFFYGMSHYFDFKTYFIPNIQAIGTWDQLFHEITGYFIYSLKGYI